MHAVENALGRIIKIGLWIVPVLPLFVAPSMLFPFITGKNFAFRILIEALFALWAGLALASPDYRPRLTKLFYAASAFTGIVFLADLLSPNPYRAFFSNYERMEGFMMIGHLYLYFVLLSAMFKTRTDWMIFWHASLGASFLVSFVGLFQRFCGGVADTVLCRIWGGVLSLSPVSVPLQSLQGGFRIDSTIGNPTYLAAYLWFHIWLIILFLWEFRHKRIARIFYVFLLAYQLATLYFTATRGAAVALVAAGIPFFAAVVFCWDKIFVSESSGVHPIDSPVRAKRSWSPGRAAAAAVLVFSIAVPLGLWLGRDAAFIQSSDVLQRLTNYSLREGTIAARFRIWNMSLKGALERPILGWGQENYYLVFQKYYDARLYGEEPWFDRSHNIFFDWLAHTGIFGIASYLSLFALSAWMIVSALRRGTMPFWHGLAILALFAGYIVQNVFVFDNLNTYLMFFGFLAYIPHLADGPLPAPASVSESRKKREQKSLRGTRSAQALVLGAGLLVLFFALLYPLHIKPILQSRALIRVLQTYGARQPMDRLIAAFKTALAYDSFGTTEVREQISNIGRNVLADDRFSRQDKESYVAFAAEELRKETDSPVRDVKHVLFLGGFFNRAADLNPQYNQEAEKILRDALALSPNRQIIYIELAQTYLARGENKQALDVLKQGWEKEKTFLYAASTLWSVAALTKQPDIIAEVEGVFALEDFNIEDLLRIAAGYQRSADFEGAAEVYKLIVSRDPKNPRLRGVYAAILVEIGRVPEARAQTEEAMRLDPSFVEEGKQFLEQLRGR